MYTVELGREITQPLYQHERAPSLGYRFHPHILNPRFSYQFTRYPTQISTQTSTFPADQIRTYRFGSVSD